MLTWSLVDQLQVRAKLTQLSKDTMLLILSPHNLIFSIGCELQLLFFAAAIIGPANNPPGSQRIGGADDVVLAHNAWHSMPTCQLFFNDYLHSR